MSSQTSEDLDPEIFGPLLHIPESSLVNLATQIRADVFHTTSSSGRLIRRIAGSYNLVHIIQLESDFQLVVRIPATGWGDILTAPTASAIESQVATLRLIASRTTIPVPQVYAFNTTTDNEIGAPYICMNFLPGQTLATASFNTSLPTPLEDRRLRTLTTLAQSLAQLAQFGFSKIGSIDEDENGELTVGPCYDWEEKEDGTISMVASGPYNTAAEYLRDHYAMTDEVIIFPGFVLSIPDFDSQNIIVDNQGNLTGVIDWDLVQTLPRCVGYARYPGWITRGWDPLKYDWPKSDAENSPEELERYRRYYNQAMGEAMQWSGDWGFTRKSHI